MSLTPIGSYHTPTITSGNATADPSLFIHFANLTDVKEGQFFIVWSWYLHRLCTDGVQAYGSVSMHISFNVSQGAAAPDVAAAVEQCASQFSLLEVDRNNNFTVHRTGQEVCPYDVLSKNATGRGDPCALKPLAQVIAANVSMAMCVAENGTHACEDNAGQRLINLGFSVSSLLVLVVTTSLLSFTL